MHMEEIDLAWRLHLHGWEVKAVPQQAVYHHAGFSLPAGKGRKVYLNYRNSLLMLLKNYQAGTLWRRLPLRIMFDGIAVFRFLRLGDVSGAWNVKMAYFWIVLHPLRVARMRRRVQQQRLLDDDAVDRVLFPGSIVWKHFKRGIATFSELEWEIDDPVSDRDQVS